MKTKKLESFSSNDLMRSCLSRMEHQASHFAVFQLWDELAPTYAPRSQALGIEGRKLVVGVPSHAHRHQLSLAKQDILKKINQALGKPFLKEIAFQISSSTKSETTSNA